eukprot:TRINITY_DN7023_c0_g2_i1.p1 TRINITY_DN7023_c0_g2~~TRINITY_DN7023_c0_g2_i1.p1  ORF type:complete len:511 (-),score=58.01 TRINITY_DN7023_c0_g2_i1:678-2210(-)
MWQCNICSTPKNGRTYLIQTRAQSGTFDTQDVRKQLTSRVTDFRLNNGLKFIVLRRESAPVISTHVLVNAGAYEEEDGKTGVAHFLEHLAFKGTPRIGTKDFKKEAPILDALDEMFYEQRMAVLQKDSDQINTLQRKLDDLQNDANKYVIPNAYGQLLEEEGGIGLNAVTSHDSTRFFVSIPSNKLELWFALESERLQFPVFRELYSEKKVIEEERYLRIEGSPLGKYVQNMIQTVMANNYRRPVIGYADDFEGLGRRQVYEYYKQHYRPDNIIIALVGNVNPYEVYQLAEKYFGGWKLESDVLAVDQQQNSAKPADINRRNFSAFSVAGPITYVGWYRPDASSNEAILFDVIGDLLSSRRTSILETKLVQRGLALQVNANSVFPGDKHPNAFLLGGIPGQNRSVDDLAQDFEQVMTEIVNDGISGMDLQKTSKAALVTLLDSLRSNSSMASNLCSYEKASGSWKGLLDDLDRIQDASVQQIQALAANIFTDDNKFVALCYPQPSFRIQS